MRCCRALLSIGAALLFTVLACRPAGAHPALWVARSATATVYLFGTIHVLPEGVKWRGPTLSAALDASQSLYVEADDDTRAHTTALIYRYGIIRANPAGDPGQHDDVRIYLHQDSDNYVSDWDRFVSMLGRAGIARLRSAAADARVPGGVRTLESMRPWLAALTLSNAATRRAGYLPRYGVGSALEREFKAQGKSVHSLETTHDQIAAFADIPTPDQLRLLDSVIDDRTRDDAQTSNVVREWLAGDATAIEASLVAPMRDGYPALYRSLLVDRNRRWALRIARLMRQHGTILVAVGAAHLVGPQSVQALLAGMGFRTERVQ